MKNGRLATFFFDYLKEVLIWYSNREIKQKRSTGYRVHEVDIMWLRLSNIVSDEVLFWLAVILWFVPFCGANELVFWYAYNVH